MLGIFLDTETNGLNSQVHKILEIAFQIVDLNTGDVKDSFEAVVQQPTEEWEKSDPESLKINGFTKQKMEQGRLPHEVSNAIIDCFQKWNIQRKGAVFICQNPSFDRAFFSQLIAPELQEAFSWPYHWLDLASMYWALGIRSAKKRHHPFPWETGLSKDVIAAQYNLPKEMKPHRAMNGVDHLRICYQAVVGFPASVQLNN